MTFEELLKACASGKLPEVTHNGRPGRVTTIKSNGRHNGCACNFGLAYDEWFHELDDTDRRSKYMRDLQLKTTT